MTATLHLLEGPVGAGKSTYAGRWQMHSDCVHFNLDQWMVNLFQPDRPDTDTMSWYMARKERCIQQIWLLAQQVLDSGTDVMLELGLVQRLQRAQFLDRIAPYQPRLEVHVLKAPTEVRKTRVQRRNQERGATYAMQVSDEIFALASSLWEPIEAEEFGDVPVHFVATHGT